MNLFSFLKKEPKPFNEGFLAVGDGHSIHFAEFGSREGVPVLNFHGGPGGRFSTKHTQSFDLKKIRLILFDQRGCGLSTYQDPFLKNTPQKAVEDGKRLLDFLKIKTKVFVSGGSYGSTLGILFAETYPEKVYGLILNSIFLARSQDLKWTQEASGLFYPDLMEKKLEKIKGKDLLKGYHKLLFSEKYKDLQTALTYYAGYEYLLGSLDPVFQTTPLTDQKIQNAQIALMFEENNFFFKEDELMKHIQKIKNIPTLILQNRLDFVCPPDQAYALYKGLSNAKLIFVPAIGHSGPSIRQRLKKEVPVFIERVLKGEWRVDQ